MRCVDTCAQVREKKSVLPPDFPKSPPSFATGFDRRRCALPVVCLFGLCAAFAGPPFTIADEPTNGAADWGGDHVGQKFPEYLTGDECLFCHRNIGPTWDVNPHQRTFQPATPDRLAIKKLAQSDQESAKETELLLGAKRVTRFLRRSKQYGKLDMLSAKFLPPTTKHEPGELANQDSIDWNPSIFADRCAGCHTTAVDTESRTHSTISLDCVTCHGLVELEHTEDISKVFLSKASLDPNHVTSICSQCHLRGGRSKSSGLPYPNTFVPGDNLFRDFEVDLSEQTISQLPQIEQHVYINVRDVVRTGQSSLTCVSCHEVHGNSSETHQGLSDSAICASCHKPNTDNSELLDSLRMESTKQATNKTCDY